MRIIVVILTFWLWALFTVFEQCGLDNKSDRIRRALTVEAGLNDGLAVPFEFGLFEWSQSYNKFTLHGYAVELRPSHANVSSLHAQLKNNNSRIYSIRSNNALANLIRNSVQVPQNIRQDSAVISIVVKKCHFSFLQVLSELPRTNRELKNHISEKG